MNYAVVIDGIVEKIIVWNGIDEWTPPEGAQVVQLSENSPVTVRWTYDGEFHQPPALSEEEMKALLS